MSAPALPPIPAKRYFTIGEVAELCGVKPHVLRYWEQEFTQLAPMKRRGNRRYYQHHEVLMVRRIRNLLYEQGFTISGARSQLENQKTRQAAPPPDSAPITEIQTSPACSPALASALTPTPSTLSEHTGAELSWDALRTELQAIRSLLD